MESRVLCTMLLGGFEWWNWMALLALITVVKDSQSICELRSIMCDHVAAMN